MFNFILLAAGLGTRFKTSHSLPKPLIDVNGIPMYQAVFSDSLRPFRERYVMSDNYIVSRKEYGIEGNNFRTVLDDGQMRGALWSAFKAAREIKDKERPLLIANCDQFMSCNSFNLKTAFYEKDWDGLLLHFIEPNGQVKWGRSLLDHKNEVIKIVEKTPVSPYAHTGHYFYRSTKMFMKYAEKCFDGDVKVNNEFFISPTFNLMIEDGKIVKPYFVDKFHGIGDPEDLTKYLEHVKLNKG